jgi:hypothetical protein
LMAEMKSSPCGLPAREHAALMFMTGYIAMDCPNGSRDDLMRGAMVCFGLGDPGPSAKPMDEEQYRVMIADYYVRRADQPRTQGRA